MGTLGTDEEVPMADTAVLKVDGSTHALVAHGATALHMTHKELVGEAVREYLANRRETINARLRAVMAQIDDTEASQVSALTGLSPERIAELGGVPE
jgi:hypothetical protein